MHSMLTREPLSAESLKAEKKFPECGGICIFEGVVRNHHEGRDVTSLIYEAYEPMAEQELHRLVKRIEDKYPECHVSAKHRLGHLQIGDVAVAIVVWAPHRHESFLACESMIDQLKKCVPIWKKEFYTNGQNAWVVCQHSHGSHL